MRARIRLALVLQATALAAVVAALVLGVGLPLSAVRPLDARAVAALAIAAALAVLGLAAAMLLRWVGRPLERLLSAAERIGRGGGLPPLGAPEDRGAGLSRAALAFERTAAALADERARLGAKVAELELANARLAAAREELLRAERLAAVGRLAAGIAHEVGNPLGAIVAYADLARSRLGGADAGSSVADAQDFLARISDETRRIDVIVRDLLDFARPAPLALASVRVAGAVEAALRLARLQPRSRAVEVQLELPDALPPVLADERRLAQVFLNLLLNAADAMGGAGRVVVAGGVHGPVVEVTVADRGPGIPAEQRSQVFDPFFTTKPPGHGTGLGLAVSHGIVQSFGGEISAEAAPDGGALFRLRLPRA